MRAIDKVLTEMLSGLEPAKKRTQQGKVNRSLPDGWKPSEATVQRLKDGGMTDAWITEQLDSMVLWTKANAGRPVTRKADWEATFLGWCRRAFLDQRGKGQQEDPKVTAKRSPQFEQPAPRVRVSQKEWDERQKQLKEMGLL